MYDNNLMVQMLDRLIAATAKATNVLLTLETLDDAITMALSIIGEGIGCDIVAVLENEFESSSRLPSQFNFIYEWAAPGFQSLAANFGSNSLPAELLGFDFLKQYFLEGAGFGGILDAWAEPVRSWLAAAQVKSAYSVPIRVNGQWWGVLCLDYCRAPIQVNAAEISVLMTIADCIGSAIQRERLRQAALRLHQERQQVAQQRTADLEAYNQVLEGRDRLLEATAKVANVLLTAENFDAAINTALGMFLKAAGCDRISVLENILESSSPLPVCYKFIYEWATPGFNIRPTVSELECISTEAIGKTLLEISSEAIGKDFLEQYFLRGEGFGGLLEEWEDPLRSSLAAAHVKSSYYVPIRVNGRWWGLLGFDYCRAAIQISPAEIAGLRTIADCIGSAIQRNRLQQERERVAQQRTAEMDESNQRLLRRDQLLEATAKAANVLLTLDDIDEAINTALRITLEAIGCDRINILENGYSPAFKLPVSYTTIYEWVVPEFEPSHIIIEDAEAVGLDPAFMEQYFLQGEGFGGLLEEWPDPPRSAFAAVQIQSAYSVAIRVNGHWWGVLCFEYCRAPIQINPAEVAVVRTIANCIGSAIERDRTQREREQIMLQKADALEAYNQVLQGRDRLLDVTARAANVLLTLDNIDVAIDSALTVLLEGTGCDRIEILENVYESSSPMPIRYLNTIQKCLDPKFKTGPTDVESAQAAELRHAFKKYFLEMDGFGGALEEWDEPLRSWLATLQIQSTYAVPIRVNGQWWGVLCFDYCRAPIQFNPAEVAVLRTIADCVGSAIERDRTQREREQIVLQRAADLEAYNQVLQGRDRLFEATAKAANVLLTLDNFDAAVNTALQFIGEGTGCDCVVVLENMFQSVSPLPSSCEFIYEWTAPGLLPISVSFGSSSLPAELLGLDFMRQYFLEGDGFGGLTEVWNEPLRSALVSVQVQSTYAVPIRMNGQWWGVLSLDYCRAPIQISAAEISVLMAIADCIGSAIQRDRTQKALLEAEQNRVAELARANTAMRHSIDWLAQEPDMNAFLGHLLEELATQVNAQDAMIFLYNAQERSLQPFVGIIDDEITFSPPFTRKISAHEWPGWEVLLRSPNPQYFDLDTDAHLFMPEYLEYHRRRNNQGVVCTLLQQRDEPMGFIGFGCVRKTLSENELELVQSLAQQATLAIQLTQLAEEAKQTALLQERARLAREIHDTLAQAFGGILMQLQAFNYFAQTQPEQAQTHLLTVQALAQEGLTEARRSVWTLYLETTEYENLDQAIAKFIEQTQLRQATPIHLAIEGTPYTLHPDLGVNLLRIAQEAITNALRHAHATIIQVHLSYSTQVLQLTIRDDGCGFDPQSTTNGFGLLGMHQRASRIGATWNLMSRPGQGTTLMITLTNSQNTAISKA